MGMTIQEILAAQQRAVKATCKYKVPLVRKSASNPAPNSVQAMLKEQQATTNATSVAELIERQRIIAAAQKSPTSGVNQVLSDKQKAVIDSIREQYKTFLTKLDKELAAQELFMPPPVSTPVEEKPTELIFTPNVPASEGFVFEAAEAPAGVNGISVGEEMGGQLAITVRPKRKRKAKAVEQESESIVETPTVEA